MIASFKSKGLAELFFRGGTARIDRRFHARLIRCLDALDGAQEARDMNVLGYRFHPLQGFDPTRYSVHVNGPWCVTFEFTGTDAERVDFQHHH